MAAYIRFNPQYQKRESRHMRSPNVLLGFASAAVLSLALGSGTALAQASKAAAPAPRGTPIKIGVLTPRSGALGELGRHNDIGLAFAMKEINALGGIMGRPVEIVEADDQSDPTQAVNEARRLISREKVDVIYGPLGSQTGLAVLPIMTEAKIANVTVVGSTAFTTQAGPYSFSLNPSAETQGIALVDFAVDQMKAKSIAIIHDGGGQAKAAAEAMVAQVAKRGVVLSGNEEYPNGATDMTPQLLNLRRAKPDHLILFAQVGQDTGHVMRNLNEIGWDIKVSGSLGTLSGVKAVLQIAGPDAYKNLSGTNLKPFGYCTNDPVGSAPYTKFLDRLKAFAPNEFAKLSPNLVIYSYDALYLLKAAIEGAKSTAGPAIAAWIEANGSKHVGIEGQFSASKTSHFLFGQDNMSIMINGDKPRSDGLQRRYGC